MTRWVVAGLLLAIAGCVSPPSMGTASRDSLQDFVVDSRIAPMYGVSGDVVWLLNPGRRPTVALLQSQTFTFDHEPTTEQLAAFCQEVGAAVGMRQVLPPAPDGSVPAHVTNTYSLTFEPYAGAIADLTAIAHEELGITERLVFSSDRAARLFYALLRASRVGKAFGARPGGLDVMMCIPEDCGVSRDDPYAMPTEANSGKTSPMPPPSTVPSGDVSQEPKE